MYRIHAMFRLYKSCPDMPVPDPFEGVGPASDGGVVLSGLRTVSSTSCLEMRHQCILRRGWRS